jgi:hypothetical protein
MSNAPRGGGDREGRGGVRLRSVAPSLYSNRVHSNRNSQDAKVAKVEHALHPAKKAILKIVQRLVCLAGKLYEVS